ncbi:MAG: response regulator transcription factor [Anaerolineales bacterium]
MQGNTEDIARVLVVDDEGAIRYSVTKTLQRIGYKVDAVASGEEALELLDQKEFDVVLTDIRMPGMTGVELLSHVREKYPDTSVTLMTGYASLSTAVESLRLGAHDYLVKPSSNKDIRESVGRGVERAQSMRRRRRLLSMIQNSVTELADTEETNPTLSLEDVEERQTRPELSEVRPLGAMTTMELGPLTLYPGRYQISVDGHTVDLTPTEFDLLLYLAAHRGRVVPCSELVREVRNYTVDEVEAREVIRPHISNLRRKIKSSDDKTDLIVNVRGVGYRLADID